MLVRGRVQYYRRPPVFPVLSALVRGLAWVVVGATVAALLVAAWPLAVAGAWAYVAAWASGWPPRRLVVAAVWCLPMVAAFAVSYAVAGDGSWEAALQAPAYAWERAWHAVIAGEWLRAMVVITPTAVPLGLLAGAGAWRARIGLIASGAAGWSPGAAVAFDERQWRRSVRSASYRVRAPGGVPLLSRHGNPVLGAVIRSVGRRPHPVLELPYQALRSHLLVVGTTGSGKTTALVRLIAGFWAAAAVRVRRDAAPAPWVVVVDAKGGFDARDSAVRAREVLAGAGADPGRVGVWPDEVSLNLWALPPARLAEVLTDLVPVAADGPAAFYADVLASVVGLAVHAPGGQPADSAGFLARLDGNWLAAAYAGDPVRAGEVRAATAHAGDVRLRYRTLFARLGPGFDGDASRDGLRRAVLRAGGHRVRTGGAGAGTSADGTGDGSGDLMGRRGRRAGLLVLDEFSAVSGRVPVHELTERCRSLGLAVIVAAQSWQGLAPDEAGRARLAGSAAGGAVVMRCPDPDALCSLAGTRKVIEVGRKLIRPGRYGDEGSGRVQNAWVADPDRVRNFRAGQAVWIHGNACTYVQVAPWRRPPAALAPAVTDDTPVLADAEAAPRLAVATGPQVPLPEGAPR